MNQTTKDILEKGKKLRQEGKLDEAIAFLNHALKLDPTSHLAYHQLGGILVQKGELEPAASSYHRAIDMNPNFPFAHYCLGKVLFKQNKLDEALASVSKAIELNSNVASFHHQLGEILAKRGRLNKAIASFQKATELDPESLSSFQQLGDIFFKQGQLNQAISSYHQAVELNPNIALIHYNLAEAYKSKSEKNEAVKHYTKALQIEPFNNSAFIQLMFMQVTPEQLEDVADCYQKLSHKDPSNPWVNVKLGDVLTRQNKIDEAITSYQAATRKLTKIFRPDYVAKYWERAKPAEPTFIIIGPMKTATSALYEYINQHPQVLPCIEKEVHFFSNNNKYPHGKDWYIAHFPLIPEGEHFITGEASPGYIVNNIQQRVFDMFPSIKLIALIRNPVDRAFSHYQHNVKHGFERQSFEDAINSELEVLKLVENPAEAAKKWRWGVHPGYLLIGFYYYFLKQWLDVFPKEQLLIINNQDLLVNPLETMGQVFRYLGLPEHLKAEYPKYYAGSYEPISQEMQKTINDVFKPHNRKLEEYLNLDLKWG